MRTERLTTTILGFLTWAFVLLVPSLHLLRLGGPPDAAVLATIAAPLVALGWGAAIRNDTLLLVGFPLAMLPALMVDEGLTGPRVYGLDSWIVTTALLGLYFGVALRLLPVRISPRLLHGLPLRSRLLLVVHGVASAALLALAVAAPSFDEAIAAAFERTHGEAAAGARALTVGLLVLVWLLVFGRLQLPALRDMLAYRPLTGARLEREIDDFRAAATSPQRVRSDLGWALLFAALFGVFLGLSLKR